MAEIKIVGYLEFTLLLRTLDLSLQRKGLIEVARVGAIIVRDDAKSRVESQGLVLTGNLEDGIGMRLSGKESDIHEATMLVGPGKKQWYGRFAEFGTKFEPARPFLHPALEENRERIDTAMKQKMGAIVSAIRST